MTALLGGDLCPQGLSIQFLESTEPEVTGALHEIFNDVASTSTSSAFPEALSSILPFQAPWTRMLTAQLGRWTALTNNFLAGGDGTAPGPAISRSLGVRCVVATHAPSFGPGHAETQLEVMGPGGEPPLRYIRSISATATDGRWTWYEGGSPFPWEETERYTARLKRDRFDRPMLLRYLEHLGVPVEDGAYGNATVHQRRVTWTSREVTLAEESSGFGL